MKQNIENIYPLSPMQEGMLFHALYNPGSDEYFTQICFKFTGEINAKNLRQACQQLMERHDILRTGFFWELAREPLQVVCKQCELAWIELDWSNEKNAIEDPLKLKEYLNTDRIQKFRLDQPPLMRFTFIHLNRTNCYLIWSHHHLLLDGWSVALALKEILNQYQSLCEGKRINFPIAKPFSQYIAWLQQLDLLKIEQFWKGYLRGFEYANHWLNRLSKKDLAINPEYREYSFALSEKLTKQLEVLASQEQVTLNTIVQSAWAILVHRYAQQDDIIFGATLSGRPPEIPDIVNRLGLFINTLPVRVRFTQGLSVNNLFKVVQDIFANISSYQYTPLAKIQSWSPIHPEALFDHILIFENYPDVDFLEEKQSKNVKVKMVAGFERTNYPLTVSVSLNNFLHTLGFNVNYEINLFDSMTVERLAKHLTQLFEIFVQSPALPIEQIDFLTPAEKHQLLIEVNDTQTNFPSEKTLIQLFSDQVALTPNNVAVIFEDQKLTYEELEIKSNHLAQYLQNMGVISEALVAIYIERSLEMIIGLLAVMKVGATYVPLDPNYPKDRIVTILNDARIQWLLTSHQFVSMFNENKYNNIKIISLDDQSIWKNNSSANLPLNYPSSQLAYVIYTSGSTGKPKGVEITHKSLINLLWSFRTILQLQAQDLWLAITTISFDISGLEIYLPLISGATILLASRENSMTPDQLIHLLTDNPVTIMQATPVTWKMLVEAGWQGREKFKILCGGEALPKRLADELLQRGKLWNLYGPTETTIWSTFAMIEKEKPIFLGKPIANTQLYILDSQLRPVPIGMPGELHIGGIGLAREYLNRPELTAEKFIVNPFSHEPDARLYKTGDLCRYVAEGNIEYLGRLDHQVKIRGYRIELGEIEFCLSQLPNIKEAIVVAGEDLTGNKQLIAYVVPKIFQDIEDSRMWNTHLQSQLKRKLPDYMVPNVIIPLEKLPLTPNGKLDRKALPKPGDKALFSQGLLPRNDIEKELFQIWTTLFENPSMSVQDNFFELGGHSLLAVQLIYAIYERFKIKIPLGKIFEMPTIERLAQFLQKNPLKITTSPIVILGQKGDKQPLFMIHPIGGQVFCYLPLANALGTSWPCYGLQQDSTGEKIVSLETLAAQYIKLIKNIQPNGPYHLCGWSLGGVIAHEMVYQLEKGGEKIAYLGLIDSYVPNELKTETHLTMTSSEMIEDFAADLGGRYGVTFKLQLSPQENDLTQQLRVLMQEAKEKNIISQLFSLEELQRLFTLWKNNLIAASQHQCKVVRSPVILYSSSEEWIDGKLQNKAIDQHEKMWKGYTLGGINTHAIPGHHYSMLVMPHLSVLLECMKNYL